MHMTIKLISLTLLLTLQAGIGWAQDAVETDVSARELIDKMIQEAKMASSNVRQLLG